MTFGTNSLWKNDALCARVAELWKDHSATQICAVVLEEMQIVLTRNSVVGWLHRQKITIAQKLDVHPKTRDDKKPRIRIVRSNTNSDARRIILTHEPAELKALRCAEIVSLGIRLVDLEADHCRYPYDGEEVTFCGHPKAEGFSYCGLHSNLCRVVPVKPKVREAEWV